jgi:branched-chain amino acid transport system ATP-binding protein
VLENLCVPREYAREHAPARRMRDEAMAILELVGFAARAEESSASLTQVDLRKLELARALAAKPRLLVSDEAMAGLSSGEVDEILEILLALNARGVAVIMIEHIMRAVMRFSQRIIVLDAGEKIAEGTPAEVVKNPAVEKAYLGE